jgi:hypothetical protein
MKQSILFSKTSQVRNNVPPVRREIILGRNSKVWLGLTKDERIAAKNFVAIGHAELESFAFTTTDRVWVLSYSRNPLENEQLLRYLEDANINEIVYVSSSSVRVSSVTQCYEYPRVKLAAELKAQSINGAKILTIGLIYSSENELPAGQNIATHLGELAAFMVAPSWSDGEGRRKNLFKVVRRPFKSGFENIAFNCYGVLMKASGSYPCLLRPFDLVFKLLDMRWYGYVYLSNRLWISTI